MAKRYYAYIKSKLQGPLTVGELKAIEGFGADTEVTEADHEEFWLPARKVKGLAKLFEKPPQAKPTAPKPAVVKRSMVCPGCGTQVDMEEGRLRVKCPYCASPLTVGKGASKAGVLAAVLCPSCGGVVEYPEDSRTAHCPWCDSYLIILGESRLFRFYVPPRLTEARAREAAGRAGEDAQVPALVFVPYWRYTAMVFFWDIGTKTVQTHRFGITEADLKHCPELCQLGPGAFTAKERVREFRSRRLDRSMRATKSPIGYQGLGERLGRMPLRPFDRAGMSKLGRVEPVVVGRKEAAEWIGGRAYHWLREQDLDRELEHGSILGGKLSLVYLPFWVFDAGKDRPLILDGIDGRRVDSAPVPRELKDRRAVEDAGKAPHAVLAECARCGQDLRIESFQTLFFCRDCRLAWRIEAGRLVEQPFRTAAERKAAGKRSLHVPVWRLRVAVHSDGKAVMSDERAFRRMVPDISYSAPQADPDKPVWVYVPAWGNMIVPRLSRVAMRYTRKQPALDFTEEEFDKVVRAVFGPEEAREMVLVVLLGVIYLQPRLLKLLRSGEIRVEATELILVPAAKSPGSEFVESCMGIAVRANELRELRS
ncbi:MAG: zinc ribbon domain-containing protein [Elusimicrobiota bacterium]